MPPVALELAGGLGSSGRGRVFAHFPWHVGFLTLAISALGVWNLGSASRGAPHQVWGSQMIWMAGVWVAVIVSCLIDYRILMRLAWPFYGLVVALLVLVLWKGKVVMGARRWFALPFMSLQPSELAKLAVALALARWFHFDVEKRKEGYGLLHIAIPMGITALPAALVLKEPDLGTALIVLAVGFSMILFARVRWRVLAILLAAGLVGAFFAWPHLKPYQQQRVRSFLNPEADVRGAGYHATQSMIAVGSGQGTGKGWGQGTQTLLSFLPEQHTDFIFSVWAEEHGFLGCLLLIGLYFALVLSAIGVAGAARERFGHFLAVGITAMIFWHAFINMGMVTGILPVVGVTLPLMSYGGSSVVAILCGIGMLLNIGMRRFAR
jgi:rod shape determining protein RodA